MTYGSLNYALMLSAPRDINARSWELPNAADAPNNGDIFSNRRGMGKITLNNQQTVAEVAYVCQPILHLLSLKKFGFKSWKPWAISLLCDSLR